MNSTILWLSHRNLAFSPFLASNREVSLYQCYFVRKFRPIVFSKYGMKLDSNNCEFSNFLDRAILVSNEYSNFLTQRQSFSSIVSLSSTVFKNCQSPGLNGGALYVSSSSPLTMVDVGFYNCDGIDSCFYAIVSKIEATRVCFYFSKASRCFYSEVKTSSNIHSYSFLSFHKCGSLGSVDRTYVKGGIVSFISPNISDSNGGLGHATCNPPGYTVRYFTYTSSSSSSVIRPSAASSGIISSSNFVNVNGCNEIIRYYNQGITVTYCVFIQYTGVIAQRDPNAPTSNGFSIKNCYSDRAFTGSAPSYSCSVGIDLIPIPYTQHVTCFIETIFTLSVSKASTRVFILFQFLIIK